MSNPLASLPPQPQYTPGDLTYNDRWNAWVAQANVAMESYKAEYRATMAAQGITVTFDTPQSNAGNPMGVPPVFTATLSKDGFSTDALISLGRAQSTDPAKLAEFDQNFNLKWQAQVSPEPLPSPWFAPPSTTPGPSTTVPVGAVTIQPTQAPANPNPGTVTTAPPATVPTGNTPPPDRLQSFWEWNWFYEQETGRKGPPPEAVGVTDGAQQMTKAQWSAKVAGWYGTQSPAPSGGQNTNPGGGVGTPQPAANTGGGGSTATKTDNQTVLIIAAMFAVGLIIAQSRG